MNRMELVLSFEGSVLLDSDLKSLNIQMEFSLEDGDERGSLQQQQLSC